MLARFYNDRLRFLEVHLISEHVKNIQEQVYSLMHRTKTQRLSRFSMGLCHCSDD